MTCPYCNHAINAWTGFQEAEKFAKHLNKCRKRPRHIVTKGATTYLADFTLNDALEIRAKSGQ